MNREYANRVVSLCEKIDNLKQEQENLEFISHIASLSEFNGSEKIEQIKKSVDDYPELLGLLLDGFQGALHILIADKKEEIEKAEKELESL